MLDYYNLIMGTNESCFVTTFNKLWKKEIESQNLPYTNAIQMENGNRLRPILMAWGYYAILPCSDNSATIVSASVASLIVASMPTQKKFFLHFRNYLHLHP